MLLCEEDGQYIIRLTDNDERSWMAIEWHHPAILNEVQNFISESK